MNSAVAEAVWVERLRFYPESRLISAFTGIDRLSEVTLSSESQWADQSPTKLLIQSMCPVAQRK